MNDDFIWRRGARVYVRRDNVTCSFVNETIDTNAPTTTAQILEALRANVASCEVTYRASLYYGGANNKQA